MPAKGERPAGNHAPGPSSVDLLSGDQREDIKGTDADQLPRTVGSIRKNSQDEVRVVLERYRGDALVDVRIYSAFTTANVPFATKRGVAVAVVKLPELVRLLVKAEEEARALGLLGDGRA